MLVTRQLINQHIRFLDAKVQDSVDREYTFSDLSRQIDAYKNLLHNKYQCQPGQRVVIGAQAGMTQTALIFACAELALSIVIVDYNRPDDFADSNYVDPKTRLLLPIDFFIINRLPEYISQNPKHRIFSKIADRTINLRTEELDYAPNSLILAKADTEIIRCTSSGTTGTPKIVVHSHEFMYHLILRNAKQFSGRAALHHNLQHGSSFATYCMPVLASEQVTDFICFEQFTDQRYFFKYDINHLMIPYTKELEEFLTSMVKNLPNLTIYTLSYIKREWLEYIKKGAVNSIVSIFGSNETSGPIFLNSAKPAETFEENRFYLVDDFYTLDFDDTGLMKVSLPYYKDTVISTNDRFEQRNGYYYHMGRTDLIRINGLPVDLIGYRTLAKELLDCDLIYDTVKSTIYLAVWNDDAELTNKVNQLDSAIQQSSDGRHTICKYKVLSQESFVRGVKIDHELLRDYFRNYV